MKGFEQLLPCAHEAISLRDQSTTTFGEYHGRDKHIFNSSALAILGLEPDAEPRSNVGDVDGAGEEGMVESPGQGRGTGAFDVSVLCSVYWDLNLLLDSTHTSKDLRLADALLWNVNVRGGVLGALVICTCGLCRMQRTDLTCIISVGA